jgi:prevent-host-death family protein
MSESSTTNLRDAKTRLSELVARVEAGDTVTITRHGRPVARLVGQLPERRPIDLQRLRALTSRLPRATTPASEVVDQLRQEARY